MKAVLIEDKKLVLGEVETPEISPTQVLVKTAYAALNRADLLQVQGDYPPPPGCPEWPGLEISGEIVKTGSEVKDFKVGDKVCALLGGGGYAQFVAVESDILLSCPSNLTMAESAGLPEVYSTAYLNLVIEGNLKRGETVLIQAGASGVGIAVTQIAKALGAKVISTVRSDEKAVVSRSVGADIVINTGEENADGKPHTDFTQADLVTVMQNNPVDLAIDCVGGANMGKCFKEMNRGGRWIMIATLAGKDCEIDLKAVYKKGIRLIGSTLRSRTPQMKSFIMHSLEKDVFPHIREGKFKPLIHAEYAYTDASKAHEEMRNNRNIGKIVLKF